MFILTYADETQMYFAESQRVFSLAEADAGSLRADVMMTDI